MQPVLADAALLERVLLLAPGLPAAVARRVRLRPHRLPERGDLCTDAARSGAAHSALETPAFAARLAAEISMLPGVARAEAGEGGLVVVRLNEAALTGILTRVAPLRAPTPRYTLLTLPVAAQTLADPLFAIHYAHARCCSVLRMSPRPGAPAGLAPMPRGGWDEAERAVLCRIDHWLRLAARNPSHRLILLYLRDLSSAFDRLWQSCRDDATVWAPRPADPERSLAGVALVAATADVLRTGMAAVGISAAEEIR